MGLLTSKINEDGSFEPSRLYHLLKPGVSENAINGLGEAEIRRPRPVYHFVWRKHPWKLWQNSFYLRTTFSIRYIRQFLRSLVLFLLPFSPIAKVRSEESSQELSEGLKEFLLSVGAGQVAITHMRPEWIIEGMQVDEPVAVTFAVPMDHSIMMEAANKGRDLGTGVHIIQKYNEGTVIAKKGANWLRTRGYTASGYCGPASGRFTSIPAALAGGLGELGKHGSIINRKYGSNFRIGYILTDANLLQTQAESFGADEFCKNCKLCVNSCPPRAIYQEKQMVRGVQKWYVDFDKCISYFNEAYGCGICLPVCPWSRPGVAEKLIVKMALKARTSQ